MNAPTINAGFVWKLLKDSYEEWSKDNAMRLSAALSYYAIFSIAPLLMIATGIVGWIYGAEAQQGVIAAQMKQMVGPQAAEALQNIVASASKTSGSSTLVGFAVLLVGASTVFGQLKDSLDSLWEVTAKPGLNLGLLVRQRLLFFGMVLVIGFLLLISLSATTALTAAGGWVEKHLGIPPVLNAIILLVVALAVESLLFALIFQVLPSAEIDWRSVWVGAIITAILFELGKLGLSQYLIHASPGSSFGAAGSVVVLLLWIFYASCIVFFGANITEVYARTMGRPIRPAHYAISTELTCSEGNPVSVSSSKGHPVPVQPNPLTPHASTPPAPSRESLVPLLREAYGTISPTTPGPRVAPRTPTGRLAGWWRQLDERPVSTLGTAVGVGLAAGLASRLLDRRLFKMRS